MKLGQLVQLGNTLKLNLARIRLARTITSACQMKPLRREVVQVPALQLQFHLVHLANTRNQFTIMVAIAQLATHV